MRSTMLDLPTNKRTTFNGLSMEVAENLRENLAKGLTPPPGVKIFRQPNGKWTAVVESPKGFDYGPHAKQLVEDFREIEATVVLDPKVGELVPA